jgi:hypothetical protein
MRVLGAVYHIQPAFSVINSYILASAKTQLAILSAIMRNIGYKTRGISIVQGQFVKHFAHAVSRSVMALW